MCAEVIRVPSRQGASPNGAQRKSGEGMPVKTIIISRNFIILIIELSRIASVNILKRNLNKAL